MREAGDEVFPAEFRRIHLQFPRRRFNNALQQIRGLRAASTAIGVNWRRVGIDRINFRIDIRNVVLARQKRCVEIGWNGRRECREIGAHRSNGVNPKARNLARSIHRQFRMAHMVAAMGITQKSFRTVRRPFNRPAANPLGSPNASDFFAIDEDFGPKPATNIRCDNPQLVFWRQSVKRGNHQPRHMGVLACGIKRVVIRARII